MTENLSPDASTPVAVTPSATTGAEPEVVSAEFSFTATIAQLLPLRRFSGTLTPVHVDPRYVVVLEIERVEASAGALAPGRRAFAIHSPSRLLGGDASAQVGRRRDFVITWSRQGEREWFSGLRAR